MPVMPARRVEALSQGRTLLFGQVRDRTAQLSAGRHGQARTRFSEFSIRLREKQKVKRIYGLLEKQFAHYFEMAERMPGITGENLLVLLEGARQRGLSARLCEFAGAGAALVRHGHSRSTAGR